MTRDLVVLFIHFIATLARSALLVLCHPPRSPADPAFQHHQASDQQLDHPAVAGGVFPFAAGPRFLIHDRDAKYGTEVPAAIRSWNINTVRTSFASPWQNCVAERWVGSCRRELLDRVIALNERHLKRLLFPSTFPTITKTAHTWTGQANAGVQNSRLTSGRLLSHDRLGGLHNRYDRLA